jgi:hypothetical protein
MMKLLAYGWIKNAYGEQPKWLAGQSKYFDRFRGYLFQKFTLSA